MYARFNWRHMPAALGALAFGAIWARDQLAIAPELIGVPSMMGLAVGVIGRAFGFGVALFFFLVFGVSLCWFDGFFLQYLPMVATALFVSALIGHGLVARVRLPRTV